MEKRNENETFSYTYSAKQQEEIKYIREKYLPRSEDTMEQLRHLDASVNEKGATVSLIIGIISTLILGLGMCCCLVWELFIPGVIIGVFGIVGVSLAYPVYVRIVNRERERIAPEIIRLTDELMK